MPVYRLHFLDRTRGHVAHTYPFPAASEAEALAFAEIWKEDAPMELWSEDSRLKSWEGPDQP